MIPSWNVCNCDHVHDVGHRLSETTVVDKEPVIVALANFFAFLQEMHI